MILEQSVKNVIKTLESTTSGTDFQALLEEERAGKNRRSMVEWLEKQDAQGTGPVGASVPEVEPVYVEPEATEEPSAVTPVVSVVDKNPLKGSEVSISDLIAALCQERDRLQRSASCGVENIRVHLSEIKITVR